MSACQGKSKSMPIVPIEQKSQFSLDTFPKDVLGKVFRFLPQTCLDNVSSVSTGWADIVDRYTGRVLIIKNGKGHIVDYTPTFDKLSIKGNFWVSLSREKLRKAEFELDGNGDIARDEGHDVFPTISNAKSVRKIGFIGLIDHKLLDCVLSTCVNLTGLYLHFSVFVKMLDGWIDDGSSNWLNLCLAPHLKELVIDCCGTTIEEVGNRQIIFNFKHALCSLYIFLLKQEFPLLEKFICSMPYIELWEGQLVFAIATFLGKHATTLKSLSFNQKYKLEEDVYHESDPDQTMENRSENKPSHKGEGDGVAPVKSKRGSKQGPYHDLPPRDVNYLSLKQLAVSAKELKSLDLESLHIILACPQESGPVWKNLLIRQTKLTKLIFVGDKIPCPTKTIEVNSFSLVTVRLDVRDLVDLDCFKDCKCLKYLTLRGKEDLNYQQDADEENDEEDEEGCHNVRHDWFTPPAQLKNARALPHSLECVEIINLRTDKDDVSFLAVLLPNLRDLTLINVGWEGRLGLSLSHLVQIWQQQRLEHFCIKASLNMMSYSELNGDQMYAINLLSCVIQSNSFTVASRFSLEVWKNEKGNYSICGGLGITLDDDDIDVFRVPNTSQILLNEDDGEESESEYEEESDSGRSEAETSEGTGTGADEEEQSENEEWEDDDGSDSDGGDGNEVENN